MACFVAPAVETVVTTVVQKVVESKEKKAELAAVNCEASLKEDIQIKGLEKAKIKLSRKLGWLNKMLWGGTALLIFEHVWHGEVVPYFPFFTSIQNGDVAGMLGEIARNGITMAALVTGVWAIVCAVVSSYEKKAAKEAHTAKEEA